MTAASAVGIPSVQLAAARLAEWLPERPFTYLVLGSGLGGLIDLVSSPVELPFREVPGLPEATVPGHAGRFVAGRLSGVPVLLQAGRLHGYEGHSSAVVGLPVRAAAGAGARCAVLTSSVGSLRRDLQRGTLALLTDILDLRAPAARAAEGRSGRQPFDPGLARLMEDVAMESGIPLPRAVYAAVTGPAYETPAEIRMLRRLGADVVAMSIAAEVNAAAEVGLPAVGISVVANLASGLRASGLDHTEVLETGNRAGRELGRLIVSFLERVAGGAGEPRPAAEPGAVRPSAPDLPQGPDGRERSG